MEPGTISSPIFLVTTMQYKPVTSLAGQVTTTWLQITRCMPRIPVMNIKFQLLYIAITNSNKDIT